MVALSTMFISLVVYLSYFQIFQADKIVGNSYNKRQWLNEETVLRGSIVDRNGKTLAYSEKNQDGQARIYKYGRIYGHIIGYSLKEYGKAGLEAGYNKELLGDQVDNPIKAIADQLTGPKEKGNNLILTIDHELQSYAEQKLRGHKGAVVLMNPKTGEIYAMISKPDFNPSKLKDQWEEIVEDKDSPLINRASMGLYTPGSIFKIITAMAVLQDQEEDIIYQCNGAINIDGYILKDYGGEAHGEIDLSKAFAESCNVAFSQMGLELGESKLRNTAEKFMFNKVIPFELITKSSTFNTSMNMTKPELGATAIGQGKLLTTPLNMAMVASSIANDGQMMEPFLVKEILSPEGRTVERRNPKALERISSKEISQQMKNMMVQVVKEGTGKNARIKNIQVAGKTGTAENETGKEHAWFVGFAPADEPKIAIAIVLENAGTTGGKSAAPIARDIMIKALNQLK